MKEVKLNIPVEVFGTELSPAEALTKYLKEHKGMTYSEIGKAINRDQRGLWGAYDRALKKQTSSFLVHPSKILVPVEIFKERKWSVLESLVFYLKENKGIKVSEISEILDKSKSTIWTVYNRARKKQ
jgi:DNA-directed RNA polymerase specialized sigma24 family protein